MGPGWRIAYARATELALTPRNQETVWGITLEPGQRYEAAYQGGGEARS